ncbi:hypothetical protein RJ641_028379 [Dillenia turbinata]|uniref:Ribulose bisphosphate carboxylase/oxygenase activase AAA helical domain-containing protein n=1 Tax=Dillenia turbinata TaxID=194707 RepID=A0AAN8WBV4_9MAGN
MKSLICLENFGGLVGFKNRNSNSLLELNLNGSGSGASVPGSPFVGSNLKRVCSRFNNKRLSSKNLKVVAEYDETKHTSKDRWGGLAYDTSDDQQDITRGKGMVDSSKHLWGPELTMRFLSVWVFGEVKVRASHSSVSSSKMGINPIMMSAGGLDSGNAGEPAKLIRQRYREAADIIAKGKMCVLFINDLDAGAGRLDRIGVCMGIFRTDNVPKEDIVKLVDTFPGQSIDFFGALRVRVCDDEVRKWISGIGVENIGRRLVNSEEGPPTQQENVKRVQLSDKYLKEAALGDADDDAIKRGTFYAKAAQRAKLPVPEGCTDPSAQNFDPTAARSDDGSCVYAS